MKLLKKLASAFAATTAIAFSSCSNLGLDNNSFQNKVSSYFVEMTSSAAVALYEIAPNDTVKNRAGVDCVPASGEHVVSFYLRNPQKYRFGEGNMTLQIGDMGLEYPSSLVTIAQDPDDSAKINITYDQSFLLAYPLGTDISPKVELFHPVSHKSFGVFDKMKISSDSPPPSVQLACFQRDGTGDNTVDHYVVCFYLPKIKKFANSYTTEGKTDVHTFYVNGTKKYLDIENDLIYNSATVTDGVWTFIDQDTSISATKPSGLNALSSSGFEFRGDGTGDEAEYAGSYTARYMTLSDKTIDEYGTDTITYSFTMEDDAGLSASLATSNKATRLSAPILQDTSGNPISDGAVVTADEESGFYTLRIVHNGMDEGDGTNPPKPCGQVNINYTITKTAGSVPFGDEHGVLRGSSAGSATIKLPGRCTFTIQATASKNYYITSLKTEATGVRVTQPAVFFVSQTGDDTNGTGARGTPFRTIKKALDTFTDPSSDYSLSEGCKVYVMSDLTMPEGAEFMTYQSTLGGASKNAMASVPFNANVTIQGYGGTWTLDASGNGTDPRSCLAVTNGKLILQNINVTGAFGQYRHSSQGYAGIFVGGGGSKNRLEYKNGRVYGVKKAPAASVYVANTYAVFENVKFENSLASPDDCYYSGVALNVGGSDAKATCINCDFIDNGALGTTSNGQSQGGAIYSSGTGAQFEMTGGSIKGTKASSSSAGVTQGGAIYLTGGSATLTNVEISGSSGADEGGAIYVTSGGLTLKSCTIKDNSAKKYGAIYCNGALMLTSTSITGNHADTKCAGVFSDGASTGVSLRGKNTIYNNYITGTTTQSNLTMPLKVIDIVLDVDGFYESLIGINVDLTDHEPTVGHPVVFTSGYSYSEGDDYPPKPGIVFRSENGYGIAPSGIEASFAVSSASSYSATDYTFTPTLRTDCAASVYPGATKTFVINDLIGNRKEPAGDPSDIYFKVKERTLYTKSGTPVTDVPDPTGKTIKITAALYSGGTKVRDATVDSSDARKITVVAKTAGDAAILPPNNYTLKVFVEFLGIKHEANIPIAIDYSAETVADYISGLSASPTNPVIVKGTVGPGMDYDSEEITAGDDGLAKVAKAIKKAASGVMISLDARETNYVPAAGSNPLANYNNNSYFAGCAKLKEMYLPDWMKGLVSREVSAWVYKGLFEGCSGLTSVEIPDSVVSVGASAFKDCSNLASITFGGTSAEWKKVEFGENWRSGVTKTNIVHCAGDNTDVPFGFFEVSYIKGSPAGGGSATIPVSGSGTEADPFIAEGSVESVTLEVDTDATSGLTTVPTGVSCLEGVGWYVLTFDRSRLGDLPASGYWTIKVTLSCDHDVYFKIMPVTTAAVPEGFVDFGIPSSGKTFTMGQSGIDDTTPHNVTLTRNFWMCDHEVTQAEYTAVMGMDNNPSNFTESPAAGETQTERPVEKVSWFDAIYYCNKRSLEEHLTPCYKVDGNADPSQWSYTLHRGASISGTITCDFNANGYRLPTEAEWEFAARGIGCGEGAQPATDAYVWAGTSTQSELVKYAWFESNAGSKTHAVKTNKTADDSRNAAGLYDMSGNVNEWCWDWRGTECYDSAQTDPTGDTTGSYPYRIYRGGCYGNEANDCSVACRGAMGPDSFSKYTGFRVVRTAPNP